MVIIILVLLLLLLLMTMEAVVCSRGAGRRGGGMLQGRGKCFDGRLGKRGRFLPQRVAEGSADVPEDGHLESFADIQAGEGCNGVQ